MSSWGLKAALIYLLIVIGLSVPLLALLFSNQFQGEEEFPWQNLWAWIYGGPVLLLCHLLLFGVRIPRSLARMPRRRSAGWAIAGTVILLAVLSLFTGLSIGYLVTNESNVHEALGDYTLLWYSGFLLISWTVWGLWLGKRLAKATNEDLIGRLMLVIYRGSVLELLIALPVHIYVRKRGDCCAPGMTFIGICAGISIALLALGPGLAPLLAEKVRRKRIAQGDDPPASEDSADEGVSDDSSDGRTSPTPE